MVSILILQIIIHKITETNYKFCDDRLFLLETYELKNEDYGFITYDTIADNATENRNYRLCRFKKSYI